MHLRALLQSRNSQFEDYLRPPRGVLCPVLRAPAVRNDVGVAVRSGVRVDVRAAVRVGVRSIAAPGRGLFCPYFFSI